MKLLFNILLRDEILFTVLMSWALAVVLIFWAVATTKLSNNFCEPFCAWLITGIVFLFPIIDIIIEYTIEK